MDYGDFAVDILKSNMAERTSKEVKGDYISTFQDKYKLVVVDNFSSTLLPLVPLLNAGASVAEYRKFLIAPSDIGYYKPATATKIASIVTSDFDKPLPDPKAFSRQATIHFLSFELFKKSHDIKIVKFPSETEAITKPLLSQQLGAIHRLYYTTPASNEVKERLAVGDVELITISGPFVQQWQRFKKSPLISTEDLSHPVVALPRSHPFSSLIDSLTPDEAIEFLNARIKERQQTFSFLGQSYAAGVVGLIAPSVLFALLLQLVFYQRHLSSISPIESTKVTEFPWIGLFKDRLSRLIFNVSIGALPILSALLCLIFLMEFRSGLFYFTIFVVTGILVLSKAVEELAPLAWRPT